MLKIYNTLTRQKEEFIPLVPNEVKMYMCGPTVYDFFHIGNARSFVNSDFIRRYLEYKGFTVKLLMNLTDIDDKIINKSKEEKRSAEEVAQNSSKAFFEDIQKLKIIPATLYPKATEHISEIIAMIEKLISTGAAYEVNGNVFFNVPTFQGYGKLSGKKIDELESGSRVEIMEEKKNPLDFALWKKAKEGEPFWQSPWGNGRPGWHIECSAMSCKHLGETFDIHAGGNDLIFPHHENEIAQSESANGKPFVKYWIHFGFLNLNEEKMSKSLGNFFTAREVLKKYPAEVIRLLFAQAHYSGPMNYSEELLTASLKGYERIKNFVDVLNERMQRNETGFLPELEISRYENDFIAAMDDDFNTPRAVAVIFDFIKEFNKVLSVNETIDRKFFEDVKNFFERTAINVLGIADFNSADQTSNVEKELIELLIRLRLDAKKEKNFLLSDKIRDGLKELGIELKDSKEGTTYKKI